MYSSLNKLFGFMFSSRSVKFFRGVCVRKLLILEKQSYQTQGLPRLHLQESSFRNFFFCNSSRNTGLILLIRKSSQYKEGIP